MTANRAGSPFFLGYRSLLGSWTRHRRGSQADVLQHFSIRRIKHFTRRYGRTVFVRSSITLQGEAMFTHDLPYCINFPPRLDRTLLELDRDDTCTVLPQLNSIFNDIQSTTDSKNWTQKPFALVASRVAVSDNGYELSSLSTLFMFLPERFAPKLHELATQTPMADAKRSRKFGPNETLQE